MLPSPLSNAMADAWCGARELGFDEKELIDEPHRLGNLCVRHKECEKESINIRGVD